MSRLALLIAERPAARHEVSRRRLIARLLGRAHLARQGLDLGAERLLALHEGPVRHVELEDGVDLRGRHATSGQGGLDQAGVGADEVQVDHLTRVTTVD